MNPELKPKAYAVSGVLMVMGVVVAAAVKGSSGELVGIFVVALGGILLLILVCFEVRPYSGDDPERSDEPDRHEMHEHRPSEQALRDEERRRLQTRRHGPPAHTGGGEVRQGRSGRAGDGRSARRPRRPS